MASFAALSKIAKGDVVTPFTVNIAEKELERMHTLVRLSNIPEPCYENSLPDGARNLGLRRDWLVEAKSLWEDSFDWRKHERHINSFPNFRATIPVPGAQHGKTIGIHFAALFSSNPAAVPILLLHGWPGSFLEFLPMLSLLRDKYPDPSRLPYHVVVPSLPGYALSDALPTDRDYGLDDVATMLNHLMTEVLGLRGYVAQAGDVGSRIARILAAQHDNCPAALLNYSPTPGLQGTEDLPVTEFEQRGLARLEWFKAQGSAYALMQATRPATVGLALSASPLALLAWVGEKFLDWTDPASFPAPSQEEKGTVAYSRALMEEAVLSASLYWLTGKAHTCFYSYRESYAIGGGPPKSHASPEYHVHAPKKLGFSYFPMELAPTPRSWIAKTGNLVFWREHDVGGHFAALEQPAVLLGDLEEFVASLGEERKKQ